MEPKDYGKALFEKKVLLAQSVKDCRNMYDYNEKFDICLAAAFEDSETDGSHFPLYDKIGGLVENLGKRLFIPNREIDLQWSVEKIYDIVQEIIIPSVELVIADVAIESTAGGMMLGRAYQTNTPVIFFYEKEKANLEATIFRSEVFSLIEYKTEEELLERLENSIKEYYKLIGDRNFKI